jgi:hypothetical protein
MLMENSHNAYKSRLTFSQLCCQCPKAACLCYYVHSRVTLACNELGTLGTVDSCIVAFIWVFALLKLHEQLK